MGDKEKYIKIIDNRFNGKIKDTLLEQLELFYEDNNSIEKNKYNIGDEVKLSKGTFIHGIFVGRKIEKDKNSLDYIKSKLPDCYICNLDGKVIIGNK